jgi:hypothetical protein
MKCKTYYFNSFSQRQLSIIENLAEHIEAKFAAVSDFVQLRQYWKQVIDDEFIKSSEWINSIN